MKGKYLVPIILIVEFAIIIIIRFNEFDQLLLNLLMSLLFTMPLLIPAINKIITDRKNKHYIVFVIIYIMTLALLIISVFVKSDNLSMLSLLIIFCVSGIFAIYSIYRSISKRAKQKTKTTEIITDIEQNNSPADNANANYIINNNNENYVGADNNSKFYIQNTETIKNNNSNILINNSDYSAPPTYIQASVLTEYEKKLYYMLDNYCKTNNFRIITKIRLADLIKSPTNNYSDFNRISRKHIDFAICNSVNLQPYALIELDDRSHNRGDRIIRDDFVNKSLVEAGYKIIHVRRLNNNTIPEINRILYQCNTAGVFYI